MVNFKTQYGQPVDHRSSGFRVESCTGLSLHAGERIEHDLVNALYGVISLLVIPVDSALVRGYLGVCHTRPACKVLFVPQEAVIPMIKLHHLP